MTEMMITLIISSVLILGLMQIYLSIKYTYNLQHGLAQIEDDGRFATYFLARRVHLAGYTGCITPSKNLIENSIEGYTSERPPSGLDITKIVKNSDILVIKTCAEIDNHLELTSIAYYIANYGQANQNGQPISGLYEKIAHKNATELMSGVSGLKIRYGISDGGNIIDYLSAQQLDKKNWLKVKTVEIHLLLNSVSPVLRKSESYHFNGKEYNAKDHLLYREWVTAVALRQAGDY